MDLDNLAFLNQRRDMSLRENVTLFSQYGYIDSWHCRYRGENQIITNNGCLKGLVLNSLLQVVEKDWSNIPNFC